MSFQDDSHIGWHTVAHHATKGVVLLPFLTHTAVQVRQLNSKARALLVSEPGARPSRLHFSICACLIQKTTAALRECHRKRAPSTPQQLASRQVLHAHDAYERERGRERERERGPKTGHFPYYLLMYIWTKSEPQRLPPFRGGGQK